MSTTFRQRQGPKKARRNGAAVAGGPAATAHLPNEPCDIYTLRDELLRTFVA